MAPRKLTLRSERLAELSTAELGSVVAASGITCELLTGICPSFGCTGYYPSIFDRCD